LRRGGVIGYNSASGAKQSLLPLQNEMRCELPTYGYQCTECKYEFSVFQNMKDDPIAVCPQCSGKVKRLLYPVGIVFKGSGWYINDSRAPEKTEKSEKSEKSEASEKSDKSDKSSTAEPVATTGTTPETSSATPAKESKPEAAAAPTTGSSPTK
jgi:putative FmdB family regulatory protein